MKIDARAVDTTVNLDTSVNLDSLTQQMGQALAAHVPGAVLPNQQDARVIELPFAQMRVEVRIQRVFDSGIVQQHLWLTGGPLGSRWIEDSFAGFGDEPSIAVVHGVHNWVEGNFAAVRAAFDGGEPNLELTCDGRIHDVFVSPIMSRGERGAAMARSLTTPIVTHLVDALPVLHPSGPTFVGAFLARAGAGSITNEIKIDGSDWPVDEELAQLPLPEGNEYGSVRQLAILVPRATRAGWPSAGAIRRTLAKLPHSESGPRVFGASTHRFELAPPLAEAPSGVPEDLSWFVTRVGAAGAGPGYGLLCPAHPAQAILRHGTFDGDEPRGVVALAHHGCGTMTLVVCDGDHRGEVRVHNTDGLSKLAESFRDYYETWLLGAVRRAPAAELCDPRTCAMPRALSSFLTQWEKEHPGQDVHEATRSLGEGSIATAADKSDYFDSGDLVDLCVGCSNLARSLHIDPRCMVAGVPPLQGR